LGALAADLQSLWEKYFNPSSSFSSSIFQRFRGRERRRGRTVNIRFSHRLFKLPACATSQI